ncbi:hypothetical protein BGZ94_009764 [Podila epigama]|nr:hypothetical protein BGZ94_009764 [Podila epigama]
MPSLGEQLGFAALLGIYDLMGRLVAVAAKHMKSEETSQVDIRTQEDESESTPEPSINTQWSAMATTNMEVAKSTTNHAWVFINVHYAIMSSDLGMLCPIRFILHWNQCTQLEELVKTAREVQPKQLLLGESDTSKVP